MKHGTLIINKEHNPNNSLWKQYPEAVYYHMQFLNPVGKDYSLLNGFAIFDSEGRTLKKSEDYIDD